MITYFKKLVKYLIKFIRQSKEINNFFYNELKVLCKEKKNAILVSWNNKKFR
jgi:hypothetical protein